MRRWRRRYIERYLVWPPAIAAAAARLAEDDVRRQLMDNHEIAVVANFKDSDPPQALLDVRAKAILREGPTPALGQFNVSGLD